MRRERCLMRRKRRRDELKPIGMNEVEDEEEEVMNRTDEVRRREEERE